MNIQKQIERVVTNGRSYNRGNTSIIPTDCLNNAVGLQIALANMECHDDKLTMEEAIGFSSQLEEVIKKFRKAGIPLDVITDGNGFKRAFENAFNAGRSYTKISGIDKFEYNPTANQITDILVSEIRQKKRLLSDEYDSRFSKY